MFIVKLCAAALLLAFLLPLSACGAPAGNGGTLESGAVFDASLYLAPEDYPRVDGSTLTIPFSEALAAAVMRLPLEEARLYVLHNKTHLAYTNLVDGRADIIFVTPPSAEELAYAAEKGVELDVIPVLRDAFVFFVNAKNPADGLRLDEIVRIYAGEIKNWNEVGGEDKEILPYQRGENSGSQTGMLELVMKGTPLAPAPTEMVFGEMSGIVDAVAFYDNAEGALGYSYYYYTQNLWRSDQIKYLRVDGVAPLTEHIADGSYPILSDVCMVLRKGEPDGSAARKLANFIRSDEGKAVAEGAGYVPVR
ncbi:MAG: substrate-binding domain-containing protein [Clostridiales Family XIII bacterium]|jgi:phosphate transport system substrate-binding protein|nr:substrate-binding domain-containing protein [Clostridiales Family XIII bacterium]